MVLDQEHLIIHQQVVMAALVDQKVIICVSTVLDQVNAISVMDKDILSILMEVKDQIVFFVVEIGNAQYVTEPDEIPKLNNILLFFLYF